MNLFDKEERIINYLQDLKYKEVWMANNSLKMKILWMLIHNKRLWKLWIDSSGKSDLPPDFYNKKLKIMMDVMRIDDHAYENEKGKIINPHNERESRLIKELIKKNPKIKDIADDGRLIINPDSGLRGYQDHNYDFYVKNFIRVVKKHIDKIDYYKCSHPKYKTIFLVFDESSPYFRFFDEKRPTKVGELFYAQPHYWWMDYNMLRILKNSKIDYLIWMTPFKKFLSPEQVSLPQVALYDVSKIKYGDLIKYESKDIQSGEI